MSDVFKVFNAIVAGVAVFVIYLFPFGAGAGERQHYKAMNCTGVFLTEVNPIIPLRCDAGA